MSHNSVLVIGNDVKKQLLPYHRFEVTHYNNKYVKEFSILEKEKESYRSYLSERKTDKKKGRAKSFLSYVGESVYGSAIVRSEETCRIDRKDKKYEFGWIIVDENENVVDIVRRTNPNGKWDWYEVGGWWDGFFLLKPGIVSEADEENFISDRTGCNFFVREMIRESLKDSDCEIIDGSINKRPGMTNCCYQRNVDIERMRREEADKAQRYWRRCARIIHERTWRPWADFEKMPDFRENADHYRKEYVSQAPVAQLLKSKTLYLFGDGADRLLDVSEEEYVEDAVNDTLTTTFVKDSIWTDPGKAGYFSSSNDDIPIREWNRRFQKMFDELPGDTLLTLIDCHW